MVAIIASVDLIDKGKKNPFLEVLQTMSPWVKQKNYLTLKAVLYTLPSKGQTCWFPPGALVSLYVIQAWQARVICSTDESSSLFELRLSTTKNVDQRLVSTSSAHLTEPDVFIIAHREKENCVPLLILHPSWRQIELAFQTLPKWSQRYLGVGDSCFNRIWKRCLR